MDTKLSVRIGLIGAASLLAVMIVTWLGGFIYWRIKISRGLSNVKREVKERLPAETELPSMLYDAGSRAMPYLLEEMRESISRGDVSTTVVLYREFYDARYLATKHKYPEGQRRSVLTGMSSSTSIEDLRRLHQFEEVRWADERQLYPPWWMWWSGFRR